MNATIYDRRLVNPAYDPDDPRTYNTAEAIAYLREQRARARSAFQARFDVADRPRDVSAMQAMHTGNWQGFFDGCCAPATAPF